MEEKKRECGNCTACYKTHPIFRIGKPAGVWCQHCKVGTGCTVYQHRPRECRGFECQWLKNFGEEGDRPDKTSIVVDYCHEDFLNAKLVSLWEVVHGTLSGGYATSLTEKMLLAGQIVLHVHLSGRRVLYILPAALPDPTALQDLVAAGIEVMVPE